MRRFGSLGWESRLGPASTGRRILPSRVSLEGPWKVLAGDLAPADAYLARLEDSTGTPFKFRETGISRAGITPASSGTAGIFRLANWSRTGSCNSASKRSTTPPMSG